MSLFLLSALFRGSLMSWATASLAGFLTVTPMAEKFVDDDQSMRRALATVAMRKVAGPRDIAQAVLFLASTLAAGHLTLVPGLQEALKAAGRSEVLVAVGGVVPPQDYDALEAAGVAAVFAPGTPVAKAALRLLEELNRRLGYAQRSAAE